MEKTNKRREWRKLIKKLQRKRRRQKEAKDLKENEQEEELARQNDPNYQSWLQQQNELQKIQNLADERQHSEEEEAWLRRELIAQKRFRAEEKLRQEKEAAAEALRLEEHKRLEEREAAQRKRREEKERLQAETKAEFERILERMEYYMENEGSQTPSELKRIIESRPGQKICEFYDRTNFCRFGFSCTYNHCRPVLSPILLIHNFFIHPLLDESLHREYENADSHLEMNERDLRQDYDEFFYDACGELERYGKILNFRALRNILPHLSGSVFVEYENKRSALKAFTALQGRFFAKRRLNVEFSKLTKWRGAVCGLSIERKCTRGLKCMYLHLFRNPENKYNTPLESRTPAAGATSQRLRTPLIATPIISWDEESPYVSRRNWRWSESPEPLVSEKILHSSKHSPQNKNLRDINEDKSRIHKHKSPKKTHKSSKHAKRDHKRRKRSRSKEFKESRKDCRS